MQVLELQTGRSTIAAQMRDITAARASAEADAAAARGQAAGLQAACQTHVVRLEALSAQLSQLQQAQAQVRLVVFVVTSVVELGSPGVLTAILMQVPRACAKPTRALIMVVECHCLRDRCLQRGHVDSITCCCAALRRLCAHVMALVRMSWSCRVRSAASFRSRSGASG